MANAPTQSADLADTMQPNPVTDDRQNKLSSLAFEHYETITGAPYETYPGLNFGDHDRIVGTLSASLQSYSGPLKKDPFLAWAVALVQTEAQRYRMLDKARGEHRSVIRAAISRALYGATEDCAVDVDDVFNEVLLLVFTLGPELAKPGSAKLSSRLFALARRHTYGYFTKKRNERHALITERVAEFGTLPGFECLSDEEIAAMNASEENYAAA